MLVLSPAFCALAGIGLSYTLSCFVSLDRKSTSNEQLDIIPPFLAPEPVDSATGSPKSEAKENTTTHSSFGYYLTQCVAVVLLLAMCFAYVKHSIMASAVAYSHPSIVQSRVRHTFPTLVLKKISLFHLLRFSFARWVTFYPGRLSGSVLLDP